VQEALNTAVMLVDVSYPKWRILFCNTQFDKATGLSGSDVAGQHVWDHFTVVGKSEVCPSPYTLPVCKKRKGVQRNYIFGINLVRWQERGLPLILHPPNLPNLQEMPYTLPICKNRPTLSQCARKEKAFRKTISFGINLMRCQVVYRAAQRTSSLQNVLSHADQLGRQGASRRSLGLETS